jgi:hypothetical protein
MRYSGWFLTTAILTVGLGFGHAGCYTSGIPGGLAVGGSSSQTNAGGTSNSNQGGSSQDRDSSVDASDAGADASDAPAGCVDSRNCSTDQVCDPTSHQCVGCMSDADCAPASERCAQHNCISIVRCTTDKQCTPNNQICDTTKTYCVYCIDYKNCVAGKACIEGLCSDAPVQMVDDAGQP